MGMTNEIFPPLSERELKGAEVARYAATQGMVLLKNEGKVLPVAADAKIAFYGNAVTRTVRGGNGSGDPFNGGLSGDGKDDVDQSPRYHIHIYDAAKASGLQIVNEDQLLRYLEKYDYAKKNAGALVMATFAFPEEVVDEDVLAAHRKETDTAIFVLSRNAGEGNDRDLTKTVNILGEQHEVGDYRMAANEKEILARLRKIYPKLVLILNVPGPIAMDEVEAIGPDAILLMGQTGQEGGPALVDVITGKVTPSGKLAMTWAEKYEDYPSAEVFLRDPDPNHATYPEGIYVGYRYFDTVGLKPAYPFGFGLSYTEFALTGALSYFEAGRHGGRLMVQAKVTNVGEYTGKEVLQVYVTKPETDLDMPLQELVAFQKTDLMPPEDEVMVRMIVKVDDLASYSEKHGGYILSAGDYVISLGTSSADTMPICTLHMPETKLIKKVSVQLPLAEDFKEDTYENRAERPVALKGLPVYEINPEDLPCEDLSMKEEDYAVTTYTTDPSYKAVMPYEKVQVIEKKDWKYADVLAGRCSVWEFLGQMTNEELAKLTCGTGWGVADEYNPVVGDSSESIPGAAGETTPDLAAYDVPTIVMADGPGGVRVKQVFDAQDLVHGGMQTIYHYCIAMPVGMLLAQSFDPEVLSAVGEAMAADMEALGIAVLLAPGINIQRNPLCGRNFEYYSEDPFLAGKMAAAMSRGIQSRKGLSACIKHYAANNQETNRNTVNSVVGQRALREIYLEPFRLAIKEGRPHTIMTSYNLINGVPTADSFDLCTGLARKEWGFDGLIMTDWNGGSSTASKSMRAGNDMIMPGGANQVLVIRKAAEIVEPEFDERGQVATNRIIPFAPILADHWNSFVPSADGKDTVLAPIAEGHTTAVAEDGTLLVDGEPVMTHALSFAESIQRAKELGINPMEDRAQAEGKIGAMNAPANLTFASFSEDGKAICYKGNYLGDLTICRGDILRCAAGVLNLIIRSEK